MGMSGESTATTIGAHTTGAYIVPLIVTTIGEGIDTIPIIVRIISTATHTAITTHMAVTAGMEDTTGASIAKREVIEGHSAWEWRRQKDSLHSQPLKSFVSTFHIQCEL